MSKSNPTRFKLKKKDVTEKFQRASGDTGCPEVQVALITAHIAALSDHFAKNPKDHSSRRGLLKMVGQRRSLLNYLKGADAKRYNQLIQKLELRK